MRKESGRAGREEEEELRADDDVVDGDVDQLDEEADETHDAEADRGGDGDLLELCKEQKK